MQIRVTPILTPTVGRDLSNIDSLSIKYAVKSANVLKVSIGNDYWRGWGTPAGRLALICSAPKKKKKIKIVLMHFSDLVNDKIHSTDDILYNYIIIAE